MYADIHCHPGAAAYDLVRLADHGKDKVPFDLWHIPQSDLSQQAAGRAATAYSQCDLAKTTTARVKLLFAALSPIEKKYFTGVDGGRIEKKIVAEFYRRAAKDGKLLAMEWMAHQIRTEPGLSNTERPELEFLERRPMAFSQDRIRYLQNGHYDYFEELKREYIFYRNKADVPGSTTEELQLDSHGSKRTWHGTYQLARNGDDFRQRFNPGSGDTMIVLTIEGIHALGIGNPEDEVIREGQQRKDVTIGMLKSRIRQIKGEEPLDGNDLVRWEHRPFFMTFAHHFNNTLCGHARSMPSLAKVIYDQRKNMNKGVLRQATYDVMQELLGLDANLSPTGATRILIDVTHMSPASRKNYYEQIIRPFNRKPENRNARIPVVASHVAYSGVHWLDDQVRNAYLEAEDEKFHVNGFLGCGINLCDEDIVEIHTSRGLLGITFDQHLLGNNSASWLMNLPFLASSRKRAVRLLYATIKEFVNIPFYYHLDEPLRIWDILCLGTGFEGLGESLPRYSTVLQFSTFEEDIIEVLSRLKKEEPVWFGGYRPAELARKICFENALEFVKRNY